MTERFALDEASWNALADVTNLPSAVQVLLERMDVARERGETAVKHVDFYETKVADKVQLFDLLFSSNCDLLLEHDLAERLRLLLDRTGCFDDTDLPSYDATFGGVRRFAPATVWAHLCCRRHHAVALLPLPSDNSPRGCIPVAVDGTERTLHFVTTETEHRAFFRDAIDIEDMGHAQLQAVAPSAFPDLQWVDSAWQELRVHKKSFFAEHRPMLVRHLSVLNDHGAAIFASETEQAARESRLRGCGVMASTESGNAKANRKSKREHTRPWQGRSIPFWWHTKISAQSGRIHFHFQAEAEPSMDGRCGYMVIGIFHPHLTV